MCVCVCVCYLLVSVLVQCQNYIVDGLNLSRMDAVWGLIPSITASLVRLQNSEGLDCPMQVLSFKENNVN